MAILKFIRAKSRIILIAIFLLLLLGFALPAIWNAVMQPQKNLAARDTKRELDLSSIKNQIEEYYRVKGYYPASTTTAPFIDSSEANNDFVWIRSMAAGDPSLMQPLDPINKLGYIYRYRSNRPPATDYEFNVKLEGSEFKMKNDGGNSDKWYEIGTDLTLMQD